MGWLVCWLVAWPVRWWLPWAIKGERDTTGNPSHTTYNHLRLWWWRWIMAYTDTPKPPVLVGMRMEREREREKDRQRYIDNHCHEEYAFILANIWYTLCIHISLLSRWSSAPRYGAASGRVWNPSWAPLFPTWAKGTRSSGLNSRWATKFRRDSPGAASQATAAMASSRAWHPAIIKSAGK